MKFWLIVCLSLLPLPLATSALAATVPVYVEDSPAAQELIDQALAMREQDRLTEAAERLQQVIEQYPYKLMPVDEQRYEDSLLWVRRRIAEDAALLDAYQALYNAAAERRLAEALEPVPDRTSLQTLARDFLLTQAGLEATFALAALHLERAEAQQATTILDSAADHPILAQDDAQAHPLQSRFHHLQAVAAAIAGEPAHAAPHIEALRDLGDNAALASIDQLASSLKAQRTDRVDGEPAQGESRAAVMPESLDEPLWQAPLQGASAGDELAPAVVPVAGDTRVYLNDLNGVRAVDRNSGWQLWSHEWSAQSTRTARRTLVVRVRAPLLDERAVLVHRERVFAVLGEATNLPARLQTDSSPTAVVSLDAASGERLWELAPADIDPSLASGYFVGTPAEAGGQIVALLCRSQVSGFQDTYVVALDPDTGSLLWRRHLSSAARLSPFAQSALPAMFTSGGVIYVTDGLGSVAAVEQRGGAMRWIRIIESEAADVRHPLAGGSASTDQPRLPQPLLAPAGLLVASPDASGMLLLDPATGELREELTSPDWTTASELRAVGGDVLALGERVTRFDGQTLEQRWTQSLEGAAGPARGRAALTDSLVLLTTGQELLALSLTDGTPQGRQPLARPGNLVVADEQLLLAAGDALRSYMHWDSAHERLRRLIDATPDDPQPGLALGDLALRAGEYEAAMHGIDSALLAIERAQIEQPQEARVSQGLVFDHLLRLASRDDDAPPAMRRELFDRLARITTGPAQEVAYHLAFADHLGASGSAAAAVDHLQAVLQDASLSQQLHRSEHVARQAGLEARHRLNQLIEQQGPQIYAAWEARAAHRLSELRDAKANSADLLGLVEQYPAATAAVRALLLAARQESEAGESAAAARLYRRAYAAAEEPTLVAQSAGELAAHYLDAQQPHRAATWLQRVAQEHPQMTLLRDGQPVVVEDWLASLAEMRTLPGQLPVVELPLAQPRIVAGSLLTPRLTVPTEPGAGGALLHESGGVQFYAGQSLQPQWHAPVEVDAPVVVALTQDQTLLWSSARLQMHALDTRTGEPLWPRADVGAILDQVGQPQQRDAARPASQRAFLEMVDLGPIQAEAARRAAEAQAQRKVHFALSERVLVIADRAGRVVGIDRMTGEVLWRVLAPMDVVNNLHAADQTLVVEGFSGYNTEAQSSSMLVIDVATGQPRFDPLEDPNALRWIGIGDERLLLTVAEAQVTAYDLATAAVAWRLNLPAERPLSQRAWTNGELLLMLTEGGVLLTADVASGQLLSRLPLRLEANELAAVQVQSVQDATHVLTQSGLYVLDARGQLLWRDAVQRDELHLLAQVATQDHVMLLAGRQGAEAAEAFARQVEAQIRAQRAQQGAQQGERIAEEVRIQLDAVPLREGRPVPQRLYVFDRSSGSLLDEHVLQGFAGLSAEGEFVAAPGALLIPSAEHVVVLPGSGLSP